MRYILFLAVAGVVVKGIVLDKKNPVGTVFQSAAEQIGFQIFCVVLWSAAIASAIGTAYTSV